MCLAVYYTPDVPKMTTVIYDIGSHGSTRGATRLPEILLAIMNDVILPV